jgi:hypothetical protein
MAIILSIKVDEMEKKLRVLTSERENASLLSMTEEEGSLTYDQFKNGIVNLLA